MLHVSSRALIVRLRYLGKLPALLRRYNSDKLWLSVISSCLDLLIVLYDDSFNVKCWRARQNVVRGDVIEWCDYYPCCSDLLLLVAVSLEALQVDCIAEFPFQCQVLAVCHHIRELPQFYLVKQALRVLLVNL